MLYYSLMQSNQDAELTVFSDSESFPRLFGHSDRVRFRHLSSIQKLGVKRAKFDLYVEMAGEPFTYLDSDVIVLEDLSCLFTGDLIAGCPDTLEEWPFIEDREHPWPGDPTLQNRRYCNSGVLFFPPSMASFLESIRDLARDDEWWLRYIIPGRLYDNHFLCAMLNRFEVEFSPLDPHAFGWSGLFSGSNWTVTRRENHLVHQPTGKMLYLAIFAQGLDPDYCFARMPAWLATFLKERGGFRSLSAGSRNTLPSPMRSVMRWIESENGALLDRVQDDIVRRVLTACAREIDVILANPGRVDRGNDSFFQHPEEFQELLYANNEPADTCWKGFQCNGAYLAPEEYDFVEECIRRYGINSIVESGAGETSAMFRGTGCSVVSIEWQEGPGAERARASGANVHIVPFDSSVNLYAEDQLSEALDGVPSDLLFVESPIGGERRRRVPEQFLKFISPRYILIHDASRDHRNIFEWMRDKGWNLAEYFPSRRGILLLERSKPERASDPIRINRPPATLPEETVVPASAPLASVNTGDAYAWEMAVLGALGPFRVSGRYFVPVVLVNRSNRDLGSSARISLSYHWRRANAELETVVPDGERSEIHPDLRPGESRRLLCEILAPGEAGTYVLEWDLVEEGVAWFSSVGGSGSMREVEILSASEILVRLQEPGA
jgi:hypothetical protein